MTTHPSTIYQSKTEKKKILQKTRGRLQSRSPISSQQKSAHSTIGVGNRAEQFYCGMATWPAEGRLSCEPVFSSGWVSASSVQPEARASQEARGHGSQQLAAC